MKRLLLVLLMCAPCWAVLTEVVRYVDPDVAVSGDGTTWGTAYSKIHTWDANEATDLVSADQYMTVYCRSSAGTNDGTATDFILSLNDWTTDATRDITIIGSDNTPGTWDGTKYVIAARTTGSASVKIACSNVTLRNIQMLATVTAVSRSYVGLAVEHTSTDINNILIEDCFIKLDASTAPVTTTYTGLYSGLHYKGTTCRNTIFWDDSACTWGIVGAVTNWSDVNTLIDFYNCTFYGGYATGIRERYGTINCYNVIMRGVNDEFRDGPNVYNCLSNDGDGSNPQTPLNGDWDNEFTDANNGDFTLVVGGNAINNGTDNPGSGLYLDDITGATRTTTWDIGAFEYGAGGGTDYASLWWWRRRHNN